MTCFTHPKTGSTIALRRLKRARPLFVFSRLPMRAVAGPALRDASRDAALLQRDEVRFRFVAGNARMKAEEQRLRQEIKPRCSYFA